MNDEITDEDIEHLKHQDFKNKKHGKECTCGYCELLREELEAKNKLKKHLWDLWSLSNGEIGEKPPEEEMKKWK